MEETELDTPVGVALEFGEFMLVSLQLKYLLYPALTKENEENLDTS
jgi:hypothetical protein